jgi:Phage integrase, N-terminal SAM-like domain
MECCLAAVSNSQEEIPMTMLRQRMTEDMRIRNLSLHTQASYLQQVSQFARHFGKSPDKLHWRDYIGADGAIARLIICRSMRFHRRSPHSIFT